MAVVLAGCWPWHKKESQQQKFMDALNRGNGAEASQIWLSMDADSRAAFAHNEGMHPNIPSDEVKKKIMKHYMDQKGVEEGAETVEQPAPYVRAGGLESLPEYVGPSGAPPQAVTVPPKTAPAN
jgi:hypothetical protein